MVPWLAALIPMVGDTVAGWFKSKASSEEAKGSIIRTAAESGLEEIRGKATIVEAEASSESWLTSTWRPIVMINFMILINLYFFGWLPDNLDAEGVSQLFELVKIGLGGYIGGRSLEKIISTLRK